MRGVWLEGVNEHSPRITGVSVDDTSMNWGFSFRKSFRMASARSACGVHRFNKTRRGGRRQAKESTAHSPSDPTWNTPATHTSLEFNTQP
jgi:hypothetical protein